jgi:geranylgeranyl pyrophosphate synthase
VSRRLLPGLEAPDPTLEREIRVRLDDVERALEKAVVADSDMLAETARYLLAAGGKRFRPMLVLLAGYFGDPTDPRLIPGAVAIELVHAATLYHDDVIDEAEYRHGVPSVNSRWTNTVAILTGDYLFARASEISAELGTDVISLLSRTIARLCDGQIREVEAAGNVEQTEDAYLEVIRRKTGALIATSCRLGGMLSDASADLLDVLEAFGEALGMAFQLSDDVMDVTSSQVELGKEPGVDIKEGVYTLPVLLALRRGDRREELAALLLDGPPEGERLARALEIVRDPAILVEVRGAVAAEVDRARGLAGRFPEGPARTTMLQLAEFLAARCGARRG